MKESEEEQKKQKEQLATADTPVPDLKAQSRLSGMQDPMEPNAKKRFDYATAYEKQIGWVFDRSKLPKIYTWY